MALVQISVCICTFNRRNALRSALARLIERDVDGCEIVVIDNNSSDGTRAMVQREFPSVRYEFEPQQGLSHARNRAVASTASDVVLFTDDDVIHAYDWLPAYRRAVDQFPEAGFFGGRVLSLWPGDRAPKWARHPLPLLDGALVHYDLGTVTRRLSRSDPLPFGASFAIRRTALDEVGAFRTDLGVHGNAPGLGEETELLQRVRDFAPGVYVGEAVCQHPVHLKRMTMRGLFRYGVASGIAHSAISGSSDRSTRAATASHLLKAGVQFAKGRGDRARQCIINAGISYAAAGSSNH